MSPTYSANYQRACEQPESPEEADLCQQWRMAKATEELVRLAERQFRATITEIGLIMVTVIFAIVGVSAAFRANQINRLALIADQRAWLKLESIRMSEPLQWERSDSGATGRIGVEFAVKNIGKTLASWVWIEAEARVGLYAPTTGEQFYRTMARSNGPGPRWGDVILPDDAPLVFPFDLDIIRDRYIVDGIGERPAVHLLIVACIR